MSMPLSKLEKFFYIDKLVIHSLDLALYQVSVLVDGEEHFVTDDKGKFLRAHSILELQKQRRNLKANKQMLRQHSAYDEMVGQPSSIGTNELEVLLKDNQFY
ncbi:hypothetical protein DA096_10070 [Vibrio rotiferianus]|uniref:DUF6482 family protein n=1 Tax=Vibrio rotiferianus TaxID=190895 RepID=UPI0011105303|nr:DUF6482 family protein [Vibrio rotiferianus]TMX33437.1 hypothetical protein DA095_17225 [Vibrio rotiferianus]TMX48291.1 hypothetical protein DA093_17215 [Vibrio rotiferianus]TMX64105.1 hypothetical protein DA096_10070 [Vibrio rotiferianus]